ncbi:anaphase promoting complex subunit CDC27 [Sporobolomyces koalae]|uniref:anaphase promoting complex subunit CDC27 n=1 Tax=Sporobolomyces koalae TaxID=500713 RepID=UPI003178AD27
MGSKDTTPGCTHEAEATAVSRSSNKPLPRLLASASASASTCAARDDFDRAGRPRSLDSRSMAGPALAPRQALLRELSLAALPYSLETSLFYAERLYALDASLEPSVYLLASVHERLGQHHQALHLVRQPVAFTAAPVAASGSGSSGTDAAAVADDLFGAVHAMPRLNRSTSSTSATKLSRPAIECSVRCARLYGRMCAKVGRDKEGRQALFRIMQPATPLVSTSSEPLELAPLSVTRADEATVIDLEMARLARSGGELERAVQSYAKVLFKLPSCWEALESLCQMGVVPFDIDTLYPVKPRPPPVPSPQPQQPWPTQPARNHPPPLGPALNSTVNAAFPFSRRNGDTQDTPLGFTTPADPGNKGYAAGPAAMVNGKTKYAWMHGGFMGMPSRKAAAVARYGDVTESSIDDQQVAFSFALSSLDTSFYPSAPLFSAPITSQSNRAGPASTVPASSSLFTPPAAVSLPTATAPGVKRTRAGNVAPASSAGALAQDETGVPGGRVKRVVRGVPGEPKPRRGAATLATGDGAPTRRSSRLSRDAGSSQGSSQPMTTSRSQTSTSGTNAGVLRSANNRDKKRSKANVGPSVLSDAGSEPRSPPSRSSSPAPSSPGCSNAVTSSFANLPETVRADAEAYVTSILRGFAQASVALSRYENSKVIQALVSLPVDQQRSVKCLVLSGRAHFEALDYEKAEESFAQARSLCPHLLDSMDVFSTVLWHRRSSTTLSLLSQDLMVLSSTHPASWIATGNTFSLNSDHASALKCFKRAVQLDVNCVYAYTLAGHECVMLEEWERATSFFREAIRRDSIHYNAWFGLGNVYMKTGKHTLADYHFRRAVEINPSNATLVCCVGSVLEKTRRYQEALEMYERACSLAPESPLARFRRIRMMVALGRYQLAEPDLLQLKSIAPLEPTVHYLLGKLYRSLGPSRRPQMLAAFTTAQDLEPRMASAIREQIECSPREGMEVDETGGVA